MDPTQQPVAPQQPQQYQPYQPYPTTGAPAQQTPPPVSRPWHNAKIALHAISIVFCLILIGISVALAVTPRFLSFQVVWIAPEAAAAIFWSVAELITICVRKGHRGIHPGAHVGLHLIFWLAFLLGAGLTAYTVAVYVDEASYYSSYRYSRYSSLSTYLRSLEAELAFLLLLIIIHFTLFVRACIETARRNRSAQPVFVPVNAYYASYPMQQQELHHPTHPVQPQQAHMSANYGQPKEVQPQYTGSTQPSVPPQTTTHDDGIQHVGHAH
ncbi:negative acting factor protein [Apiospora saccharicola]